MRDIQFPAAVQENPVVEDTDDMHDALVVGMNILGSAMQSESQLSKKLTTRGFSARTVEIVLATLRDRKYLDDSALSESIARRRAEHGYGNAYIRNDLWRRGIGEEMIGVAIHNLVEDEIARAARYLKQWMAVHCADRMASDITNAVRRMGNVLQRRGFSSSTIYAVLARYENF